MDATIKARWVEALRSGEYEQAKGSLIVEAPSGKMEYCCLGVLCDLAVQDGAIDPPIRYEDTDFYTDEERAEFTNGEREYSGEWVFANGTVFPDGTGGPRYQGEILPQAVMSWAGLVEQNPIISDVEGLMGSPLDDEDEVYESEAASYNDDLHADFATIAELIEKDGSL